MLNWALFFSYIIRFHFVLIFQIVLSTQILYFTLKPLYKIIIVI